MKTVITVLELSHLIGSQHGTFGDPCVSVDGVARGNGTLTVIAIYDTLDPPTEEDTVTAVPVDRTRGVHYRANIFTAPPSTEMSAAVTPRSTSIAGGAVAVTVTVGSDARRGKGYSEGLGETDSASY